MRTRSWIGGLGTVLLAVVAIGVVIALGNGSARPDPEGVLEITLEDFAMDPAAFTLPVGESVTLEFVNQSDFNHNLTFGRSAREEGGAIVGFEEDLLSGIKATVDPPSAWIDPTETVDAVTISVPADSSVTASFTLPEDRIGVWQVGCFLGPSCGREAPVAELTVE